MAFGIDITGFTPKTLSDVKADLEATFRSAFGASFDVSENSAAGQLIGIWADRLAELWEVAQAVDAAKDPDRATGAELEQVCAITGTIREAASKSTVTLTATGTPSTALASGRVASVVVTGVKFQTTAAATIQTLVAWAATTAYVVGQRVTNASRAYQCITAGTSAGSGGPTTTSLDITDNTVHWAYLGEGTGAVDVAAESQETGPKVAVARTLTTIETPVGGWSSVTNILDAVPGADLETDAALRIRREDELASGANAALEAIRSAVLDVDGVTTCTVFENTTDTTDSDGVPPHAVEVLVEGGSDADIRAAVFSSVAAGIATHGGVSGSVTDSQGISHTVKFSRPTAVNIWITFDVIKYDSSFPADGSDQIKAAAAAFGNARGIGVDAVSLPLKGACTVVAGVLDVPLGKIGTASSPTVETTIVITSRQRAVYDTSRIVVNLSSGTP